MIFTPVAIAGAGLFCLFTRYFSRNCCNSNNSDDENGDTDNNGCCPSIFENQIPDEDLVIPSRILMPRYSSMSMRTTTSSNNSIDSILNKSIVTETEFENVPASSDACHEEGVLDGQMPLIVDSSDGTKSDSLGPASPPDLLLLTGNAAFDGYKNFLLNTAKAAQGPSIVNVHDTRNKSNSFSSNDIKSKLFTSTDAKSTYFTFHDLKTKSFDDSREKKDYDNDDSMDDFDSKYSEKYQSYLKANNIPYKPQTIGRSISSEKKVQFNGMTDVRFFKTELLSNSNEEE